jgi:hypothetical protein
MSALFLRGRWGPVVTIQGCSATRSDRTSRVSYHRRPFYRHPPSPPRHVFFSVGRCSILVARSPLVMDAQVGNPPPLWNSRNPQDAHRRMGAVIDAAAAAAGVTPSSSASSCAFRVAHVAPDRFCRCVNDRRNERRLRCDAMWCGGWQEVWSGAADDSVECTENAPRAIRRGYIDVHCSCGCVWHRRREHRESLRQPGSLDRVP